MKSSVAILKSLGLGLLLIAGAAGVLLYSDLSSRNRDAARRDVARPMRVAVVQHTSIAVLEDGVNGVLAALRERGYVDGGRMNLRRYNAEGDMSTANAIAKEVTSADYDLIVSISTVTLQTIANANRFAIPPRRHVFGLVSDPYGAGVGVSRDNHLDHPPYMTGLGTLPPVSDAFQLARQLRPALKRVGLVWNPTEANSVAATNLARAVCSKLGITLVEANAENSTAVGEAAASVLSRGVEALWVSPDQTVILGVDVLLNAAKRARVPVFTSIPGNIRKGALFDLGADYIALGHQEGLMAADVLDGRDPSQIPVENATPVRLEINRTVLSGLRDRWDIPDDVLQKANTVVDDTGSRVKDQVLATPSTPPVAAVSLPRKMTVDLIEYVDTPNAELARQGVMKGLSESGLVLGKDFEIRRHVAHGDIATLSSMIDAAVTQRTDLIITASTPSLQSAMQRGRGTPIVFTMVSNPFIAAVGKTDADHLPFVTGSYLHPPVDELLAALKLCLPGARRIGTLYTPGEINSVDSKEQLETAAKKAGFQFEAVGITSSSEVRDAAASLAGRGLDALTQISDNLISSSFPAVMEAANRFRLPVVTYSPSVAEMGPLLVVGRDYFDNGVDSGRIAARVLRGEPTANIPFVAASALAYVVNLKVAQAYEITVPSELLSRAGRVIR